MAMFGLFAFMTPIFLATIAFCAVAMYFEFRVGNVHIVDKAWAVPLIQIETLLTFVGIGYLIGTIRFLRREIAFIERGIDAMLLLKVVTAEVACHRKISVQGKVVGVTRFLLGESSLA